MALRIWGGGTNPVPTGDINVANNWTGDTVPVGGDDVMFNGQHGSASVTAGLATWAAVNIGSITVTPSYEGSVGATGTPLQVNDLTTLMYSGQGTEFWLQINGTCDLAWILDSGNGNDACHLDGGTITLLYVFKGRVTLDTGLTALNIYSHYKASQPTDVTLTIETGVFLNNIAQGGGKITCSSDVGTLTKAAGSFTLSAGDITQLFNYSGRFVWNAPGSTIGRCDIRGSSFVGSGNPVAKTITDLFVLYGARADLRGGSVTISNPVQGLGGVVLTDVGTEITFG